MIAKRRYRGFSLTEVLLAVGTLAIGMIFIGGTFLVGIHFSTIATERTIAAVVADEAFAKIRLYHIPADPNLAFDQQTPFELLNPIDSDEFSYPSTKTLSEKQYYWSALCRPVDSDPNNRLIQVTVFVSRKVGINTKYRKPAAPLNPAIAVYYPVPVEVSISKVGSNVLRIEPGKEAFINDGYSIVENTTGHIYRVVERPAEQPDTILIDRSWNPDNRYPEPDLVWVVPPPLGGGRNPCVAIYQKVMRF